MYKANTIRVNEAVMSMNRTILHSGENRFYASVEMVDNPEIRDFLLAVCGDSTTIMNGFLNWNIVCHTRRKKRGKDNGTA